MTRPTVSARARRAVRVRGTVQGVGFRPAMYRLAHALELGGFVHNDGEGVWLEIEGDPPALARFLTALPSALPPAARVESLETVELEPRGERRFRIAPSPARRTGASAEAAAAELPIDAAPCEACLRELSDPADRRHRYPFVNCTDCGPRYTIARALPYDRSRTTMAAFALCPACRREYEDPADRRFHAEPNACPTCGPRARWLEAGATAEGDAAVRIAADRLRRGAIVAVKGAGGYALAVDATNAPAVERLRRRKRRPHKPLAVMARDPTHAARIAHLAPRTEEALRAPARPIVLLPRRDPSPLAPGVAPGLVEVGVFLPPTPLQLLLARDGPPLLVMTSGNRASEPIARDDEEALTALAGIADAWLMHDRPIHARADDSVLRPMAGGLVPVRRARGFVPTALELPVPCARPVLAVGAESRSTVCLAHGRRAVLSPHLGRLSEAGGYAFFREAAEHLATLLGVAPERVAHDLHPDHRSTRWALASGLPRVGVQHHHAHVAACLAEHGHAGPALGVAFDGTGYGADGGVWGGEVLAVAGARARRVAHLRPLALAGGEAAIREPWRVALAALADAGLDADRLEVDPARRAAVARLIARGTARVESTGAGRWFDAVAALCGLRHAVSYDGQAAIELEALAAGHPDAPAPYPHALRPEGDALEIDLRPCVRAIASDLRRGVERARIAARFHETLAAAVAETCARARDDGAPATVALSGGCFLNRRLTERCLARLEARGFAVRIHRRVPPNDGGLALGQAAIAAAHAEGVWGG